MGMRFSGLTGAGLWGLFLAFGMVLLGASPKALAVQPVVINEFLASTDRA